MKKVGIIKETQKFSIVSDGFTMLDSFPSMSDSEDIEGSVYIAESDENTDDYTFKYSINGKPYVEIQNPNTFKNIKLSLDGNYNVYVGKNKVIFKKFADDTYMVY